MYMEKKDYSQFVKVALMLSAVFVFATAVYNFKHTLEFSGWLTTTVLTVSELIIAGSFVLIYLKKMAGVYILFALMVFNIITSAIYGSYQSIMISVFLIVWTSLLLSVNKDGISGWTILKDNSRKKGCFSGKNKA